MVVIWRCQVGDLQLHVSWPCLSPPRVGPMSVWVCLPTAWLPSAYIIQSALTIHSALPASAHPQNTRSRRCHSYIRAPAPAHAHTRSVCNWTLPNEAPLTL